MPENYWESLTTSRLQRRRLLAGGGVLAASAVLLAACGGSSSQSQPANADKSGLLAAPVDTSKQAKRGGNLRRSANSDPASLDAHGGGATVVSYFEFAYSRPFARKPGYLEPSQNEIEGDLASSWEWSPDHLQLTAKLRPGATWHNLAPVNGRPVDIDDLLFTWKRISSVGLYRTILANSANPDAPILSMTAPDSTTLLFKFKEPLSYVQDYLAHRGNFPVVPKEAENPQVLDLRTKLIGSGPFLLSDYRPSIGLTFKRHPTYWDKERPYVDQVEYPVVSEYAAALAQFRTGNIHTYPVRQEDALSLKQDVPQLDMYASGVSVDGRSTMFGWDNQALRDKRVRQALSMTIARDDWIDVSYNTDTFAKAGLNIEKRWNSALTATDSATGWWLDPKGKDFGPNAKFYRRDIDEAKKLLAAAGFANGLDVISNHFTTAQHGTDFTKLIDLWESMGSDAGFRFQKNIIDYNDYLARFRDTSGKFSGVTYRSGPPPPSDDPVAKLSYEYTTKGAAGFYGFDAAGKGDASGDPYVEAQVAKAKVEFDTEKRRAIVHDVQRYLAEQLYHVRWPGGATSLSLAWPAVRNFGVYRPGNATDSITSNMTWWLDDTLAPQKH